MDDYNMTQCAYTTQITDTDTQCRNKCSCCTWQYVVVTTVLVTLFQQQKFSFTNYSSAISHISEGPKTNVSQASSVPISRVDVMKTHNGDRAGHQNIDFNQSLMWLTAQKSMSPCVHCTSFRSYEIITVHKLHDVQKRHIMFCYNDNKLLIV